MIAYPSLLPSLRQVLGRSTRVTRGCFVPGAAIPQPRRPSFGSETKVAHPATDEQSLEGRAQRRSRGGSIGRGPRAELERHVKLDYDAPVSWDFRWSLRQRGFLPRATASLLLGVNLSSRCFFRCPGSAALRVLPAWRVAHDPLSFSHPGCVWFG